MKLYKVTSPEGTFEDGKNVVANAVKTVVWAGTQADARKARIEFEAPFKELKPRVRPTVEVEEVDVPTSKQELLAWLNENAV